MNKKLRRNNGSLLIYDLLYGQNYYNKHKKE